MVVRKVFFLLALVSLVYLSHAQQESTHKEKVILGVSVDVMMLPQTMAREVQETMGFKVLSPVVIQANLVKQHTVKYITPSEEQLELIQAEELLESEMELLKLDQAAIDKEIARIKKLLEQEKREEKVAYYKQLEKDCHDDSRHFPVPCYIQ